MSCPYFEEVVMVFCRAYPVKKLVPRNLSTANSRCLGANYERCPFFEEVARVDPETNVAVESGRKEASS